MLNQQGTPSCEVLLNEAAELLKNSRAADALIRTIEAKKLRQVCRDLDYVRGLCFMVLKRPYDAREALKEELRYFPDNQPAKEMLLEVEREVLPNVTNLSMSTNAEFQELIKVVRPYTMIWDGRLANLYDLAMRVCTENIPGNFVECGVAAGGSSGLLSAVIARHSRLPRLLYACDSYEGMPAPTADDVVQGTTAQSTGWGTGTCAALEASVEEVCTKLGAVHVLRTVKGYFEESLPRMRGEIGPIAFLHLDGDWYESTKAILRNLYEQVVPGGYLQIDDYGHWEGCKKAVHEFEAAIGTHFDLKAADGPGVWFQKLR